MGVLLKLPAVARGVPYRQGCAESRVKLCNDVKLRYEYKLVRVLVAIGVVAKVRVQPLNG